MQFLKGPIKSYAAIVKRHYLALVIIVFLGQMAVTAIAGVAIPLNIVGLIVHLQSDAALHYVKVIIILCIIVAVGELVLAGLRQIISWGGRRKLIRQMATTLQTSRLPLEQSERGGALNNLLGDYISSWKEFSSAIFAQLPMLVTTLGGTIWVLFASNIAWLGWLAISLSVVAPVVMHKTGKAVRTKIKASSSAERAEFGSLTSMLVDHAMQWLMKPLGEECQEMGDKAQKLRKQTSMLVWRRLGEVQSLKLALIACGLITVLGTREQASSSVVLIIATLSTHLMLMYQILDTLHNAHSKVVELTDLQEAAQQRPPLPAALKAEIFISNIEVAYTFIDPDDGPQTKYVRIAHKEPVVLRPGINCLMVETGRGKSTLLRVLSGSLIPYTGRILFGGENGHELRDYEPKDRILLVEQHLHRLEMTLKKLFRGNVIAGRQALQWAAFPDAPLGQSIGSFSGGERRRALTAAGLYIAAQNNYAVLCLDEPTNDLDVGHIRQLCEGLRALAEKYPNLIIVVASHNPMLQKNAKYCIVW